MQFTITSQSDLEPALLAEELLTAFGTNFGISTAGTQVTCNTDHDLLDPVQFQAALDAHAANAPARALAKVIKSLTDKVQQHLDKEAQKLGYDNIISACSYAAGTTANKYKADGISFLNWRSNVWDHCYTLLNTPDIQMPTEAELIQGLPERV